MISQLVIAAIGLLALDMALDERPRRRLLAPYVGLVGQPFWFYETSTAGQWGMFALSCLYTGLYLWHARRNWPALRAQSNRSTH